MTEKQKYTPNWRVVKEITGKGDVSHLIQDMNSDPPETIARIVYSNESEANAHLLASSFDLKEACKLLYKAWEALIPCLANSVVQDYGLVLTTAPLKAKTALAKAEGKEV